MSFNLNVGFYIFGLLYINHGSSSATAKQEHEEKEGKIKGRIIVSVGSFVHRVEDVAGGLLY